MEHDLQRNNVVKGGFFCCILTTGTQNNVQGKTEVCDLSWSDYKVLVLSAYNCAIWEGFTVIIIIIIIIIVIIIIIIIIN